jgi:signal transduction histidine kinase
MDDPARLLRAGQRSATAPDYVSALRRFQAGPFGPAVQDLPTFFRHLAAAFRQVFRAQVVTIWNNNVYGPCLVLLASSPERTPDDGADTISASTSYTAAAIADCDIVFSSLTEELSGRHFEDPQIISRLGLTHLVSVPITDPFDHQFVTCIVNLYYDHVPNSSTPDLGLLDWLRSATSVALDYLFYRIDEDIRRVVASLAPTATGIAPLFDKLVTDIKTRLKASSSTIFSVEETPDAGVAVYVAGSSDIQSAMRRYSHPLTHQTTATDEERALLTEAISRKRPFMLKDEDDETPSVQGKRGRWNYMAVPIVATDRASRAQRVLGILQCQKDTGRDTRDSFSALDLSTLESYQRAIAPTIDRFLRLRKSSLRRFVDTTLSAAIGGDDLSSNLTKALAAVARLFNAAAASIYLLETQTPGAQPPQSPAVPRLVLKAAVGLDAPLLKLEAPPFYEIGEGTTGDIVLKGIINFKTEQERLAYPNRRAKYNHVVDYHQHNRKSPAFLGITIGPQSGPLGALKIEYIEPSEEHPEAYFTDNDEHTASIISSLFAFLIEHHEYKGRMLAEFKRLAQNSIEIEKAYSEHAAIVAVMGSLEKSGWGDALLSLYDQAHQQLCGYLSSRKDTDIPIGALLASIGEDCVHCISLRENRPIFVDATGREQPSSRPTTVLWKPGNAQYVLPLRIEKREQDEVPELLGTLQVLIPDGRFPDPDAELILQGFAGHLAVAISRSRVLRRALDVTNQVIPSLRFVVAETIGGMIVHSLGHELKLILQELAKMLERQDLRERRDVLEPLERWQVRLAKGQAALENALNAIRAPADRSSAVQEIEPLIQPVIDFWYPLLQEAGCRIKPHINTTHSRCRLNAYAFREVMGALIVNSVQAHAKHITVTTERLPEVRIPAGELILRPLCVDTLDDGEGISSPDTEVLFDPTYTTKPDKFGTGLGLFFARRLARTAGGDLFVLSNMADSSGTGAAFRLVLPTYDMESTKE